MIQTPKLSPVCNRFISLLPNFSWANTKELWNNLIAKEQSHSRNPLMMSRHPHLQPRMRSILLNWLSEVSEVYQLHRETYYLALDYFDRYLSVQNEVGKQQLQLVGITCLFIAAKVQEIYPPKVSDFAYVTDGACTDQQILTKELVILKSLGWNLNSMTVNSWLTIYMQLYAMLQKQNSKLAGQTNSASVQLDAQHRLSPSKHQPPRKRRRTVLSSSPGLQVADTNKQVVAANCVKREFDVKIDSDDEKLQSPDGTSHHHHHSNPSNNLSNITNKQQSDDHQSPPPAQQSKKAGKEDCKTPTSGGVSMKSFISSNLKSNKEQDEDEFMYQKYDSFFYAQIAHLVDLSMLDIDSLKFSYNVISASALYHFTNMPIVIQCTGKRIVVHCLDCQSRSVAN